MPAVDVKARISNCTVRKGEFVAQELSKLNRVEELQLLTLVMTVFQNAI